MNLADKLTLNCFYDNFIIICKTQAERFIVQIKTDLQGPLAEEDKKEHYVVLVSGLDELPEYKCIGILHEKNQGKYLEIVRNYTKELAENYRIPFFDLTQDSAQISAKCIGGIRTAEELLKRQREISSGLYPSEHTSFD